MNNYIVEITKHLRDNLGTDWASRVYRSANINVVDDAYSANNVEYLFSAYVLPIDTTTGTTTDGVSTIIKRFGIYLFVPNSDSQDGSDAFDVCNDAQDKITSLLSKFIPSDGLEEIEFSSGREYRYGRGYYIYELQYQYAVLAESAFSGNVNLVIYHAKGETTDGNYEYDTQYIKGCYASRQLGVNRDNTGLRTGNSLTARFEGDATLLLGGHDFCVIGDDSVIYTDKQSAIDAGREVYEINTVRRYYDSMGAVIGCEITGN